MNQQVPGPARFQEYVLTPSFPNHEAEALPVKLLTQLLGHEVCVGKKQNLQDCVNPKSASFKDFKSRLTSFSFFFLLFLTYEKQ